jgi:hypothetical protein
MKLRNVFFPLFLMIGCIFFAGCTTAAGPVGKWELDSGVQKAFEAGKVFPDHTYYYLGFYAAPHSVIAVSNRYTLRTRAWAQVDITEQMLQGWLTMFRTENATGCDYYGGVILTPDGQQAGVWYSQNNINIVQTPEPGVLEVFQPHTISGATCGAPDDGRSNGGRL